MNEFGVYWGWCESCGHCERLKGLSKTMSYGECPRCHQQAFNEDFKAEPQNVSRDWLADFLEGQHYIRQTRSVAMIIVLAAVVGFIGFPLLNFIPKKESKPT